MPEIAINDNNFPDLSIEESNPRPADIYIFSFREKRSPEGNRINQIVLPEVRRNISFNGLGRSRLFMTASRCLYAVHIEGRALVLNQ